MTDHNLLSEGRQRGLWLAVCSCGWRDDEPTQFPLKAHRGHLEHVLRPEHNACRGCAIVLDNWDDLFCSPACKRAGGSARIEPVEIRPDEDQGAMFEVERRA